MRTKLPFAGRCLILSFVMMLVSALVAQELIELQISEEQKSSGSGEHTRIKTEILPAQRGIIMDRNGQVLTHNEPIAEVQINRHDMRDIDQVTYGLAYNQVIHSEEWQKTTDPEEREKLLEKKRSELLDNAKVKYTPEERAEIHRASLHDEKAAKMLLKYDEAVCEEYFRAHDRLVAELLARYASCTISGTVMTEEEIVQTIGQYDKEAAIKEAKARGEESTVHLTQQIYLIKDMRPDAAAQLKAAVEASRIKGVEIKIGNKRNYLMPHMAAHVIGTVRGDTGTGVSGVEASFNAHLAGYPGRREYRTDARGQVVPHEDDRYQEPHHGLNLRLTLDMRIQAICEEELDKGLKELNCPVGCMIVMEAVSGDIIAMVNRPSYNLNTREIITPTGIYKYQTYTDRDGKINNGERNYACQTSYEPGSTFKPIAVLTAIDTKKVRINERVNSSPFSIGGALVSDGKRSGRLAGTMTAGCALKKSCNPATVSILLRCSWEEYKDYLGRLGILDKAGIDLPAVHTGSIRHKNLEKCSQREMASMAYGYAISVSPMHVLQAYAAIANGGVRVKPRLVDCMLTAGGDVYNPCEPRPGENVRIMQRTTARDVLGALLSVTDTNPNGERGTGTGTAAAIPGYKVGGKTGTAEKVVNGQYVSKFHVASFAGIFPLDENINWEAEMAKPKEERKKVYVVLTVIDGVAGGGGTAAAPIFKRVAERIIELENIPPTNLKEYEKHLRKKEAEAKKAEKSKA